MLYTYISHSRIPKTYYGVKFNYGDKKEVTGVIRDRRFVLCGARLEPHKIPEKLGVTDAVDGLKSENDDKVVLEIYDNGIGIPEKDLKRVFDKSFTGTNGRDKVKSTGMGLYIIKKLCNKLGHNISIESKENEYTKVILEFGKNDVYKF